MKCISTIVKELETEVEQNNIDCNVAVMHGELKDFDYTAKLSDDNMYYFKKEHNINRPEGYKNIINFSKTLRA